MFQHLMEAVNVQRLLGCTLNEAHAIVLADYAAHEPASSNVIYGVDFSRGKRKGEKIEAL
jgi:hypothetical protein